MSNVFTLDALSVHTRKWTRISQRRWKHAELLERVYTLACFLEQLVSLLLSRIMLSSIGADGRESRTWISDFRYKVVYTVRWTATAPPAQTAGSLLVTPYRIVTTGFICPKSSTSWSQNPAIACSCFQHRCRADLLCFVPSFESMVHVALNTLQCMRIFVKNDYYVLFLS